MLEEQKKREIIHLITMRDRARIRSDELNDVLVRTMRLTKQQTGCTLEELGELLGVSRQRIHQILKGE